MSNETEIEAHVFAAFLDQVKKSAELREALKSTEKTVHVICAEADIQLANQLKAIFEDMSGRAEGEAKVCDEESTIGDILAPGQNAVIEGGYLRKSNEVYCFIAPSESTIQAREREQLFRYSKGAFASELGAKGTILVFSPNSDRKTFQQETYDNELMYLDGKTGPQTIIERISKGLI